ncbi:site-specific integrase [uncultured Bacteroides sp.]|uniref:tyrosine-type recombinase/integrase n=1 Tax=uncultured Bacteroides sp. TaxID=162156 RepID=UPI002AAB6D36|nr:site-specific integrase [uncultured Bacteroides sp.]
MNSITDFANVLISELIDSERYGTAKAYLSSVRRLNSFMGHAKLVFDDVTPALLKQYELYLYTEGCKRNSVSLYMRMLRSICNQAYRQGFMSSVIGLFDEVFTGNDSAEKRATSPNVIKRLSEMDLEAYPSLIFARDLFLLSFYLRGIPFVDLAHLRKSDIQMGVLRYRRSKTKRLLTVAVEPCAQAILKKYASYTKKSPYLLPIISPVGESEYKQYQSALRLYNKRLARISVMLKLKGHLTSYVARHSWATAAYRQGIPVTVISESLGHASEKVTYTYLASFENRTLRNANRKVIALLNLNSRRKMIPKKPPIISTLKNLL